MSEFDTGMVVFIRQKTNQGKCTLTKNELNTVVKNTLKDCNESRNADTLAVVDQWFRL